jgi:large subunit ribosomal protein L21e
MVQRIGGFRRKSRHKLKKTIKQKGKISLSRFFQEFSVGDKVQLNAEPAVQKGMYYPKFHGKVGVVAGKSGECYNIQIMDKNKEKTLIVHPVHIKKV